MKTTRKHRIHKMENKNTTPRNKYKRILKNIIQVTRK